MEKMICLQNTVTSGIDRHWPQNALTSGGIDEALDVELHYHWIMSKKCLSACVTFLTQFLLNCVNTIYKKLFNFSNFIMDQAWSLTTQVLDRILTDLFLPKDNILNSIKNRRPESTCGHILLQLSRCMISWLCICLISLRTIPQPALQYMSSKFHAKNPDLRRSESCLSLSK